MKKSYISLLLVAVATPALGGRTRAAPRVLQSCPLGDNYPVGTTYTNETIAACVKDCGATTIVDPSEVCGANETRIEWDSLSAVGLPGPPGAPGPTGMFKCFVISMMRRIFNLAKISPFLSCHSMGIRSNWTYGIHRTPRPDWPHWPGRHSYGAYWSSGANW